MIVIIKLCGSPYTKYKTYERIGVEYADSTNRPLGNTDAVARLIHSLPDICRICDSRKSDIFAQRPRSQWDRDHCNVWLKGRRKK